MRLLEYYEKHRPRQYRTEWYHVWLCDILERAYNERKNVLLELPPRHGKSELVNAYAPAWRLETHFDSMFGLVCNSDSLAKKFSTACRRLCPLELEVDRDAQWKVKGLESLNFTYLAAGIRGQLTGHGFDTIICDDLIKSGQDAKSDTVRDSVWENVVSAALNRLTPDGIIIAMQARLHQQDPIGKLLELDHLKFLRLHLPAINNGDDAYFEDGYSGERVNFPAYKSLSQRYDQAKLEEIRSTVASYYWNAQYQQQPSMGDLSYFDVEKMPRYQNSQCDRCWMAVDAAQTATENGSYTAMVGLGFDSSGLKVLNVRRGKWRADAMAENVQDFYQALARQTGIFPEAVIVEQAAGGYGLIDRLSSELPIQAIIPKGSKEERAGAICYLVNRGQVSLPVSAPWLKPFVEELSNFPLCSSKDMTDAFVHALSFASRPSEFKPKVITEIHVYDALEEYKGPHQQFEEEFRRMGLGLPLLDNPDFEIY